MKVETDAVQMNNAAGLTAAGCAAIAAGDARFDFSAVKHCDSSAVAMLLAWQRAASEKNLTLAFDALPASLTQLAVLYGLQDIALPGLALPESTQQHAS